MVEYTRFAAGIGEKRTGRRPPHVQFANAHDDSRLVQFVARFGPVWGDMTAHKPSRTQVETWVRVRESLNGLRRERALISSAMHLASLMIDEELGQPEMIAHVLAGIASALWMKGAEWEYEEGNFSKWYGIRLWNPIQAIALEGGWPAGVPLNEFLLTLRGQRLKLRAASLLCEVLNIAEFRPVLVPTIDGYAELPVHDRRGVLPALYFMLRQDILHRKGIAICRLVDCGAFFKIERSGQHFCSDRCSRLQRQREYWNEKGKALRKKRLRRRRIQGR